MWVTLLHTILWKAVSSHHFLWPTDCEWHCTFCERHSHHIFSYDQQAVSDIVKGSHITSFPMTNRQWVILHILWKAVSHITSFPITNRKWVTLFILWKAVSSHLSYDHQEVSDVVHFVKGSLITLFHDQQEVSLDLAHFVKGSLTVTSFPMTNGKWVTLHILWKAVSSRLFLWLQAVSDIAHFCER